MGNIKWMFQKLNQHFFGLNPFLKKFGTLKMED